VEIIQSLKIHLKNLKKTNSSENQWSLNEIVLKRSVSRGKEGRERNEGKERKEGEEGKERNEGKEGKEGEEGKERKEGEEGKEEKEEKDKKVPHKFSESLRKKSISSMKKRGAGAPKLRHSRKGDEVYDNKRLSLVLKKSITDVLGLETETKPPTPRTPNQTISLPSEFIHWDKQELSDWALDCGLETFSINILNEDIDGDILLEINDAELEKLGLTMGLRKRVLKAINDSKNL